MQQVVEARLGDAEAARSTRLRSTPPADRSQIRASKSHRRLRSCGYRSPAHPPAMGVRGAGLSITLTFQGTRSLTRLARKGSLGTPGSSPGEALSRKRERVMERAARESRRRETFSSARKRITRRREQFHAACSRPRTPTPRASRPRSIALSHILSLSSRTAARVEDPRKPIRDPFRNW
jgi:hypothetical protein